jgi:dTDP-4-amino-4,6-dideoxygalactose transaminase
MIEAFEATLAEGCGRRYAVALSSGTAARTRRFSRRGAPDAAVVVPTMTFPATANAVLWTGPSRSSDCEVESGTMDPTCWSRPQDAWAILSGQPIPSRPHGCE